jgi:hypothetical protein
VREWRKVEELILKIIENSLVGGAFILMLWHFLTKFSTTQERIVSGLDNMTERMLEISHTLANLDERVKALEEKE